MNFTDLIHIINETDVYLKQKAYVAVNQSLTFKNWLTGFYIVEFEQNGEDRAKYGEKLLPTIAKECKSRGLKGYSLTNLLLCRQFYNVYGRIGIIFTNKDNAIYQTLSDKFPQVQIYQTLSDKSYEAFDFEISVSELIQKLSYSHFIELIQLNDPLKRAFYEIECIRGNWSVRELQRQIGSLLFERTGYHNNKQKLLALIQNDAAKLQPEDIIHNPYMFEFFGLKQSDIESEDKFENHLIKHLQEFLLELGKGFCFVARQKRILIDNRQYKIDLVFYHKILKCDVIVELKTRKFEHADASQLRVYLNYYRKNEMIEGDNPPIGILLCTGKSDELVEYATTGIDEQMFISEYMLELPSKQQLQEFLLKEKRQFGIE